MTVKIPEELIQRLQEAGLSTRRFLKLDGKAAVEKDWPSRLYEAHELMAVHRGNYGVAAGDGLVLIDVDDEPLVSWLQQHLPDTFKVQSPRHKTPHYYLKITGGKPENLVLYWGVDEKGQRKDVGHLQAQNKYLVGPCSVHPDGGLYEIINNAPIAEISWTQLHNILKPFLKEVQDSVEEAAHKERQQTGLNLDIMQVVPLAGLRRQGGEYYGPHPVHGSKTGRNFWVNPAKNCWHCFRHGSGGGPLLWVAVEEGIIRCEEAGPGALRGDLFKHVLQKAVERGYVREAQVTHKQQQEGIPLGDYVLKLVGAKAVFFDRNGQPKLSYPAEGIDGLRTKQRIAKKLGVNEDDVDRAIAKFVTVIEQPKPTLKDEEKQTSRELVEKAKKLLKDPKLLLHIIQALKQLGLVGETRNALSTFFDILSAKTQWPINRRWSGRSGQGKTTIVMKVAELFPPEMVMVLSGATKKTLWYHPDAEEVDEYTRRMNLEGKVIIILEESESKEFLDEVKPLLSHDKKELPYAFVEKVGNVNITRKMLLYGWPAYIGITTEAELREEQQTRALLGTPDYGKDKWKAVIAEDSLKAAKLGVEAETELIQTIQEAIRLLKPYRVWIPWLPIVATSFPHEEAKSMREWMFFHSFLDSIALLFQEQLPKVIVNGEVRMAAPATIFEIAIEIAKAGFQETISKLPRDVREFADYLAEQKQDSWTYRQLQKEYSKCFGGAVPLSTLKSRYVQKLVDEGLVEIDDSKKPYRIKSVEKRSTSSTVFEKSLEIIRSEEGKRFLSRLGSSTEEGGEKILQFMDSNGKPILWAELVNTLSQASLVDDVKKAISRSKSEEYAFTSLFSESVELVNRFFEKNQESKKVEPQDNLTLKLEDVASLTRLTSNVQGKCVNCGFQGRMDWQATKHDGSWNLLCGDCGLRLETDKNGEKPVLSLKASEEPCKMDVSQTPVSPQASVEGLKPKPTWFWRRIPPGGKCELCGGWAVEYEIREPVYGQHLKRCEQCYKKLRALTSEADWKHFEDEC